MAHKRNVLALLLGLSALVLACTVPIQLRERDQADDGPVTKITVISRNYRLAAEAYENIDAFSSYRLENRHYLTDDDGRSSELTKIVAHDAAGNLRLLVYLGDRLETERYYVAGRAYEYEPAYAGWVDKGADPPGDGLRNLGPGAAVAGLTDNPAELLVQFGMVPAQASRETWGDRPARRYELEAALTNRAEAVDRPPDESVFELAGNLWLDEATGALLKSEIILYDRNSGHERHRHLLEVSEINSVPTIRLPGPVVDPAAIAAATATAQAWTVLEAEMNYRGTPVSFELIPLAAEQTSGSAPLQANVQIIVRQLPEHILRAENIDPFLSQLRQQLTMSLPQRNLVVTSSGYRLEQRDLEAQTLQVVYTFNADLEDFGHAELILSGRGNPQFAPVPVK